MGQALHLSGGLVSRIGSNTLNFETMDRAAAGLVSIGGVNTTSMNLATGAGMTALNIGTGMGTGDVITIGSGAIGGVSIVLDGDVTVNGAETVLGDSTFQGNIELGDAASDTIDVQGLMTFSTGLIGASGGAVGDLPFSHGSRSIAVADGATQANLTLQGAANSAGAGGDIIFTPGGGSTTDGNLVFGNTADATDLGYQIFADTNDGTAEAGIRWAKATGRWQVQYDGTAAWHNIITDNEQAEVTAGTDQYQHLEWDGTDSWDPVANYTIPNDNTGAAAVTRSIVVEGKAFANGNGDHLSIMSGDATGGGSGVASFLMLGGGADNSGAYTGAVFVGIDPFATTLASHVYMGYCTTGGNNLIHTNSDTGGSEYISLDKEVRFGGENTCDIHINYAGGGGGHVVTDIPFGNAADRAIYINDSGTARSLTLHGSDGLAATNPGGDTILRGGDGNTTGAGGTLRLRGGTSTGTVGSVYLGDSQTLNVFMGAGTNGIQYDDATNTLVAIGTGSINLDTTNSRTEIKGVAIVDNAAITAANFTTLFDGSDASALHTHAGLSSSDVTVPVTTDGSSTTFVCYVTAADAIASAQANAAGTSKAIGIRTAAGQLLITGVTTLQMEGALTASIGDDLWLSATQAGAVTNVAPSTAGQFLVYVGQAKTAGNTPSAYIRPERPLAL